MATLSSPTLQQLVTDVRILLNQTDPLNTFWTDGELTSYLNEAVRLYFAEAVLNNEGYFTVQTGTSIPDLDIVSGVETVALPTDCFEVKNVWKQIDDGWVSLSYINSLTNSYTFDGGSAANAYVPYYYFQGNNLVLRPTPNFSQTGGIRVEYMQLPDTMVWGGDSMTSQVSPIFKQLIEMYAVYKAKLKEAMVDNGTMHKIPEENLNMLLQSFRTTIAKRSKSPTNVATFNPEFC